MTLTTSEPPLEQPESFEDRWARIDEEEQRRIDEGESLSDHLFDLGVRLMEGQRGT